MADNEIILVEQMLYDILADSPTHIPVYSGFAPEDAEPPFYVFAHQDANDIWGLGVVASRVLTKMRYVVRAFDRGWSFTAVRSMADFIDTEVHNAQGITNDGRTIAILRQYPVASREGVPDGDPMVGLGGVYEVTIGGLSPDDLALYGASYDEGSA